MKWLIWSPAIAIIFFAAVVPGGLILFGLPLLTLGYLLISVIALGGRAEHRAAPRPRAVHARSQRPTYQRKEF
jgi:urea transporter